jgi:hypothetical protein
VNLLVAQVVVLLPGGIGLGDGGGGRGVGAGGGGEGRGVGAGEGGGGRGLSGGGLVGTGVVELPEMTMSALHSTSSSSSSEQPRKCSSLV